MNDFKNICALLLIAMSITGCIEVGGGGSTSAAVDADTTSNSDQTQTSPVAE